MYYCIVLWLVLLEYEHKAEIVGIQVLCVSVVLLLRLLLLGLANDKAIYTFIEEKKLESFSCAIMPIKEGTREQSNTENDVSDANVHQKVPLIPPCKMQPLKLHY